MSLQKLARPKVCAAGLLLLMAILAGGAAWRESITVDEVAHVGAGVSYLQKLDYRMNEEHPPLAKVLAAIPLAIRGVHADYSNASWTFSGGFFHQYLGEWAFGHAVAMQWNDPYATIRWARFPMLLLTVALGWVMYVFGSRLGGEWGGLLCLAAYVTTPAFLTFGPLVLTDADNVGVCRDVAGADAGNGLEVRIGVRRRAAIKIFVGAAVVLLRGFYFEPAFAPDS